MLEKFKIEMEVRDSETDIQGIVNNANYMVYLEHARHKWLKEIGINFTEWSQKKLQLVLLSASLEFKKSLVPGDKFYVTCKVGESAGKVKFTIEQEIYLVETDELILKANFTGTCVNENATSRKEKLFAPDLLKLD